MLYFIIFLLGAGIMFLVLHAIFKDNFFDSSGFIYACILGGITLAYGSFIITGKCENMNYTTQKTEVYALSAVTADGEYYVYDNEKVSVKIIENEGKETFESYDQENVTIVEGEEASIQIQKSVANNDRSLNFWLLTDSAWDDEDKIESVVITVPKQQNTPTKQLETTTKEE